MQRTSIQLAVNDLVRGAALYRIWTYQAYHAITARYRRSLLGPFWTAGSMVATSLSLAIVFGGIYGQSLREFLPYIMSGFLVWQIASLPMADAPEIFVGASNTIKNHAYPFTYYIFEALCKNLFTFAHNYVVFAIMALIVRGLAFPHWSFFLGLSFTYLTVFFYSTLSAMLAARFRDIRFILPYISQLLFFVTPIFWKPELIKGPRRMIADLNPLYHLVQLTRAPFLGRAPTQADWTYSFLLLVIGIIGWTVFFPAFRRRIPFWL